MNKMEKILAESGNQLLKRRSAQTAHLIKIRQDRIVSELYEEILMMEGQLENIKDLSIESRDSLRPTSKTFDPDEFCKEIQRLKLLIRDKRIEHDQAKETYEELFTEEDKTKEEE